MRISDWSSDVCSSDLDRLDEVRARFEHLAGADPDFTVIENSGLTDFVDGTDAETKAGPAGDRGSADGNDMCRSEEHTSELQSLMRITFAVFCLKKTNKEEQKSTTHTSLQK